MKNKMMKLFTMACVLMCMLLPFSVRAEETGQIVSVEYLEDGSSFVTILEELPTATRASGTKSGRKTAQYRNERGTVLWSVTVHGDFTYNGKTATCTRATKSTTCPASNWKITASSAGKSENRATAKATAKKYVNGKVTRTVSKSVTLTCSPSGSLS